jgi:hypothetical protein
MVLRRAYRWWLTRRTMNCAVVLLAVTAGPGHAQRLGRLYSVPKPYVLGWWVVDTAPRSPADLPALSLLTHRTARLAEAEWQRRALTGALIGVGAAFLIAAGPQVLCERSSGSSCPSYLLDVAKCSTITVPLGALAGLVGLLPDRWSVRAAPDPPF